MKKTAKRNDKIPRINLLKGYISLVVQISILSLLNTLLNPKYLNNPSEANTQRTVTILSHIKEIVQNSLCYFIKFILLR